MSSYFSLPSFARAKQNKEKLEKENPQHPVLKAEDEQFLQKQITNDDSAPKAEDAPVTQITDSGEMKELSKEEAEQAGAGADQVAVPEVQPETGDGAQESKVDEAEASKSESTDDAKAAKSEKDSEKEAEESKPVITQTAKPEPTEDAQASESDKATEESQPSEVETTKSESTEDQEASKPDEKTEDTVDDPPEEVPDESAGKSDTTAEKPKKSKKKKSFDLPSQEEAEAATKNFNAGAGGSSASTTDASGEKKTWSSYLPSIGSKKDQSGDKKAETDSAEKSEKSTEDKPAEDSKSGQPSQQGDKQTWAGYASTAYSSLPSIPSIPSIASIPSLPAWGSKDKDGKGEPVLNEDGTVNDEKTKEKQQNEVSVLLDKLDMSSINNRVFAFSGETQKIYARFAEILKDTMNGGPTAYEDMEALMKDAGPQLEKQFASMPPFVQMLVKSLPAKLGTSLGPELLAAASEKPGADMKTRMAAASKAKSSGDAEINVASSSTDTTQQDGEKKKRKIPGLKGLMSGQGVVASILRNIVSFLTTRFPFLASSVNVVMSLAVFILMFVFWYCHKRGKEMRLAKQAEAREKGEEVPGDEDGGDLEVDATDDDEPAESDGAEEKSGAAAADTIASAVKDDETTEAVPESAEKTTEEAPEKAQPSEASEPDSKEELKGAELTAEKTIGV